MASASVVDIYATPIYNTYLSISVTNLDKLLLF